MNAIKTLCTLSLTFLLNQACATSAPVSVFHRFDELEMSRDFSSQTISSKPFVTNITGLEKSAGPEENVLTPSQADGLLQEDFQSFRSDLTLHEPSLTAQEKKELKQILKAFAVRQEFPSEGYTFLQKPALINSWFLIADLEDMLIQRNVSDEEIKDENGKYISTKYSYKTSRNLAVRYFIYDPKARHLVFSGLVRSTADAVHDRIGSGDSGDFPEAPGMIKSLSQNFQKFLRALPAKQGN